MKKRIPAFLLQIILAVSFSFCLFGCSGQKEPEKEIIIKVPHTSTMNCISNENIKNAYTLLELAGRDFIAQYDKDVRIKDLLLLRRGNPRACSGEEAPLWCLYSYPARRIADYLHLTG